MSIFTLRLSPPLLLVLVLVLASPGDGPLAVAVAGPLAAALALPAPRTDGAVSLERALQDRRSVRAFAARPLDLTTVGQVLWAAQGLTHPLGLRTAPSAGATFPLELYLVAGEVAGLAAGVYRYRPDGHELVPVAAGDIRGELAAAARGQSWLQSAPVSVVVAAVPERTAQRYGQRATRYVAMEVGAVVQNIQLQGAALDLGSTFIGAFEDAAVQRLMGLAPQEQPLAIVPIGHLPGP
jgi:SagB-type dehydrogenase family enzyme